MIKAVKYELQLVLTAIVFYSRIPLSKFVEYSDDKINKSIRYLPMVGWIVGLIASFVFYLALKIVPVPLAVIISMIFSILLTGAFHEDGFADFFDGFGGGITKQRILDIMKDSRVGTYGVIALVLNLLSKFVTMAYIEPQQLVWVILCMHPFSRLWPVFVIYSTAYSRDDATSKIRPISKNTSLLSVIIALISVLPIAYLISWKIYLPAFFSLMLFTILFRFYIIKRIDGYTGDCLGALEQFSEIVFLLIVVIINYVNL